MEPEVVLGRLVAACIEARGHPVLDERDEAVDDVALALEGIVRERLAGEWEWDSRHVGLDGLKTLSINAEGDKRLHIVGAFYLLDAHGDRMLPVEAALSVEPGAVSTVKLGGADSVFPMPQSERQFVRGVQGAAWRHRIELRLAR